MSAAAEIFKQAVESLIDLSKALGGDFTTAKEARVRSDTPYARRIYTGTLFAAIEGLTSTMKQVALASIPFKNM